MAITVYTDSTGQALSDQITGGDGRPIDLTGYDSVKLNMRYADSEVKKITLGLATVDDATSGHVSYAWKPADIDTPGRYYAWWILKDGSIQTSTDEFEVSIKEHSPGIEIRTGSVYSFCRSIIPETWAALEKDKDYGDSLLQARIEVTKLTLLGSAVNVDDEINLDIRIQQFLAKLTVLGLMSTAMEYWMNQRESVSSTGTAEAISFPERIQHLTNIRDQLMREVAEERDEIEELIDLSPSVSINSVPQFSPGTDEGFKTPLPGENFFDYAFPQKNNDFW